MLHLILCEDWTAGRDALLAQVASDIQNRKGNRVIIVPELISHEYERLLCSYGGNTASRYAEVLTFSRMATRASELAGLGSQDCLDKGGRLVAMASAACSLSSRLKSFASVETKPEFLTDLVNAVDEFKRCCITPEILKTAAEDTDGSLQQKLEELSLLMETYNAICSTGKKDPRDLMTWLLEKMEDSSYGKDHVFYVDGFPDFTRQHQAILTHLMSVSPNITICLNCDAPDSEKMAFEKAGATASALLRTARALDIPAEIQVISQYSHCTSPICQALFQGGITNQISHLQVCRADSVWDEVLWAAGMCRKLAANRARWRDITLVLPDHEKYRNLVDLIFGRMHVPVYQCGNESILRKSVIATVLTALDAVLEDFQQEDVIRYFRSALSGMQSEDCDILENYTYIWHISGLSHWNTTWKNHPDGLSGELDDASIARLALLNELREAAVRPLINLHDSFKRALTLSDKVASLIAFLDETNIQLQLENMAARMLAEGSYREMQIVNQLWNILIQAMTQLSATLGNTHWEDAHFVRLLRLLLSQYDVGTIPPVLDAVQAGPISAMRCHSAPHLIVLGANEGSLPRYSGSAGILTDQERTTLRAIGVPLTGGAMEGVQEEFAEIYGVFCGAEQTIHVCCSGQQSSFIFQRLSRMAGGEEAVDIGLGFASADRTDAAGYLVSHADWRRAESLGLAEQFNDIRQKSDFSLGKIAPQHIRKLYGETLLMSASQIDTQAECRMSYFLKYGMKAKERKEAQIDPAEFGTYVHDVLENTCREIRDKGGFHLVSREETLEIAHRYSEQYQNTHFSQIDSDRAKHLFKRNLQELEMIVTDLWEELSVSLFSPAEFELGFGMKDDSHHLDAIAIPSKSIRAFLRGFVDRVDIWQSPESLYYRVVDYKTGKKAFDYCDVSCGVGLQMLLYLFALKNSHIFSENAHAYPAGVQYFPARAAYLSMDGVPDEADLIKDRQKEQQRSGLLLQDDDVLAAMEPGDTPFRCYSRKKGEPNGDFVDRDQLRLLEKHVFRELGRLVDEIASGEIAANPYSRGSSHGACTFCPYGTICRKDSVSDQRNYKTLKAAEFWEVLRKEDE